MYIYIYIYIYIYNLSLQTRPRPSTVYRIVKRFDETGTIFSIQGLCENTTKTLGIHDESAISEMVLDDPSLHLQHHVFHKSGNNISTSSICRFLHQQCFSHKKLTFRAQKQSEQLREKYTEEMSLYKPETLIFVDETGYDRCAALCCYGYDNPTRETSHL